MADLRCVLRLRARWHVVQRLHQLGEEPLERTALVAAQHLVGELTRLARYGTHRTSPSPPPRSYTTHAPPLTATSDPHHAHDPPSTDPPPPPTPHTANTGPPGQRSPRRGPSGPAHETTPDDAPPSPRSVTTPRRLCTGQCITANPPAGTVSRYEAAPLRVCRRCLKIGVVLGVCGCERGGGWGGLCRPVCSRMHVVA